MFLNALRHLTNQTRTENGAVTPLTTRSDVLDLFATIGALRSANEQDIISRFQRAWAEDHDLALRTLFYARDVRGGLGERRVFRILLAYLARMEPETVRRNLRAVAEYGRYDDLLVLMDTPCEQDLLALIGEQLREDLRRDAQDEPVSLMAKWLPSVNASNEHTVRMAKQIARALGMTDAAYRKTLTRLRARIRILENNLRERDYTFDYQAQPSRAMFVYRRAFLRNDEERYRAFMERVASGEATLHTGSLNPCDLVQQALSFHGTPAERMVLDTTWKALEDFTDDRNALCVVDTSGSMFGLGNPVPFAVAMSLGLYFAERNKGAFRNHFITFSERPRLIEIKGRDLVERVNYCRSFSEVANTNIYGVFELVLNAALSEGVPQEEMPQTLYIISDMEFDACSRNADLSNFEYARRRYAQHGYRLPNLVFWNVQSRHVQQPVTKDERGVALVSGYTPRLFMQVITNKTPYQLMLEVLNGERYRALCA